MGEDYIRLHKVMTRGIEVSKHSIDKYLNAGAVDELNKEGFINYIQSFSAVLHGHHMVEDQKIFPYFKDQLPEVPYQQLTSEHEIFNEGLQEINTATKELTAENKELKSLNLLKSGLNKVDRLWDAHIQIENTQLYGKIRSLDMDPEEISKIGNEFKEFFQAHSGPPYLIIPFVLYNLSLEDRKIISQGFPDEVANELLFGDWKDKWISMQPYLLK